MSGIAATRRTRTWPVSRERISVPRAAAPFVLLLVAVLWGLFVAAVHLGYPFSSDYGEALTLAGALRIAEDGLSAGYAYNDAYYQAPLLSYPPVFPVLVASLYGLGLPLLLSGRLLALLGYAAVGVVLSLLVRREGVPRWLLLACIVLPFGCYPFFVWSAVARVDSLALAFSLFGYYLITSGSRAVAGSIARLNSAPGILRLSGAALCFALALSTKQSMVAALAAVVLAGLLTRGHRISSLLLAGLTAVGVLLGLAGMQAVTGGEYLNIITAERNTAFSVGRMLGFYALFGALFAGLVMLGTAAWLNLRKSQVTFHRRALLCYWPLAFVVAGTVGKLGSADYYLMELAVATILVASAGYTRLLVGGLGAPAIWVRRWPLLRAGIVVQAVFLVVAIVVSGIILFQNRITRPAFKHATTHLASDSTADVFSDNPGMLLAAGRDDQVYDGFLYRMSYVQDPEADSKEAADMAWGRWQVMVLSFDPSARANDREFEKRWPPELLDAVRQRYHTVEVVNDARGRTLYYVLEPR
jgi:hypothetical protein